MSSYGITPAEVAAISNAWCANTPLLHPMNAVQLHTGPPGPTGTANVSAVGVRQVVPLTYASGLIIISGTPPTWPYITAGELITGISFWTDLTAGYCWYTAPLLASEQDAIGDQFIINAGSIPFVFGLAS